MVGICEIYPIGKSVEKSKNGKYKFTFVNGIVDVVGQSMIDCCDVFTIWTGEDLEKTKSLRFMIPVLAKLDINGDFTKILEILDTPLGNTEKKGVNK